MRKDAILRQVMDEPEPEFFSVQVRLQKKQCISRYEEYVPIEVNSETTWSEDLDEVIEMLPSARTGNTGLGAARQTSSAASDAVSHL